MTDLVQGSLFIWILRDTERMGELFDFDGTITGHAGWMVARDQPFYTSAWLVYFIQIYIILFYHFLFHNIYKVRGQASLGQHVRLPP